MDLNQSFQELLEAVGARIVSHLVYERLVQGHLVEPCWCQPRWHQFHYEVCEHGF